VVGGGGLQVELREDGRDVLLRAADGEVQLVGDRLVGPTLGKPGEDVPFSVGQAGEALVGQCSGGDGQEARGIPMVAQHGDEPVVVGDCAGVEQVATLIGARAADGIPILGGEHDGLVVIVAGCDDNDFAAVKVAVAL